MVECVIVRPCFDDSSSVSHLWAQRLIDSIKDKATIVADLAGENATREKTEQALKSHPEADFVFFDHGDREGLIAQDGKNRVIDKNNDSLLANRVVYTMACLWASDGGVDAYVKGARVVVGYTEVFIITVYDEELFCEAANSGFIAYVSGESDWKKIKQLMTEAFNKAIDRAEDVWTKMWLRWDRDALRVYDGEPPKSTCPFRRFAVRLLGKAGWRINRAFGWGFLLFSVGWGVALHDFTHQVYELKGTMLSVEGGYLGFIVCLIGFIVLTWNHIQWLTSKR